MKQIKADTKMTAKRLHESLRHQLMARGINPDNYLKLYKQDSQILVSDIPFNGSLERILQKNLVGKNYKVSTYDYSGN